MPRLGSAGERRPAPLLTDPDPSPRRAALHLVYDAICVGALVASSPWWLARAALDRHFRAMVRGRLTLGLPMHPGAAARPRILVHGVSVGEVKAAQPLVEMLQARRPEYDVVVSSTTGTGLEVARKLFPERLVVGFPADASVLVARFLRRVRPACVVLIELEMWPNFLRRANRAGVPVAVVNGRVTEKSLRRYRRFALPQFSRISLFCAQNERYAKRFAELARTDERVVVTGNVKVDGLRVGRRSLSPSSDLARAVRGGPGQPVIVAGSTHDPEELTVARALRSAAPGARIVIVPRHPGRCPEIARQLEARGDPPQLLTRLRSGGEATDPDRPLLIDTIGELEEAYACADLVFVGGSLVPHGGQNMLEPAAQGLPVLYGPHVDNFRDEAALLEEAGASVRVQDASRLEAEVRRLLADRAAREVMGSAGMQAVGRQRGATARTLDALERCVLGA